MSEVKPQVGYKTITPEIASVLLSRSKRKNVPVKKLKIDQYARTMSRDEWDEFNSQAISIDVDEDIANGHQRLMACVKSGAAFRTLFITGVPKTTFMNEDTGRSREAGHFFALMGEKNYTSLAAGARAMHLWERGLWKYAVSSGNVMASIITNEDLRLELKRRPHLRDAADFYVRNEFSIRGRFPQGLIVALYAITKGHPKHAKFWEELIERVGSDKESPAWKLNRRIDVAKGHQTTLGRAATHALLTKAWNMYCSDKWGEMVVWNKGRERMPDPVTTIKQALLTPNGNPAEIITTTPKTAKVKQRQSPTVTKPVQPKVKKKKSQKLHGGLGRAA